MPTFTGHLLHMNHDFKLLTTGGKKIDIGFVLRKFLASLNRKSVDFSKMSKSYALFASDASENRLRCVPRKRTVLVRKAHPGGEYDVYNDIISVLIDCNGQSVEIDMEYGQYVRIEKSAPGPYTPILQFHRAGIEIRS